MKITDLRAMKNVWILLICALWFAACSSDKEPCAFIPDTDGSQVTLSWESLEDSLPQITSKEQLAAFFTNHPAVRELFFNRPAYPGDSTFINRLYNRFTNPHIDTLLQETHRVFGDGSALRAEFQRAFANIKYYYPDFVPPRIVTIISGLETDLYVSDSLVVIGLDYYLGPKAKYKPNMYEYMLRRYQPDFIVPSVMLLTGIDGSFNRVNPEDKTVLADMIAYGKAYHFTKQMLPCTPDSILIGYTAQEMDGSRKFEHLIWSRFVEDNVLFSTSHLVKQRFIGERPKTVEVGESCPGRIGTWVGWQIVRKYAEDHPDLSLPQLMSKSDAATLFRDSGYKPHVVAVGGKERI